MSSDTLCNPCMVVQIKTENFGDKGGPTIYHITQDLEYNSLPPDERNGVTARKKIKVDFGPLSIVGYVDADTYEIGIEMRIFGVKIANLFGNLRDGVFTQIDLVACKGEVGFSLKNGHEVWVHVDLQVVFDGHYQKAIKIVGL